jgi:cytochrome c
MTRDMVIGLVCAALLGAVVAGCGNDDVNVRVARALTGGDPARGHDLLTQYGCVSCHTIPGVLDATANVGPPLTRVAMRSYLAGRIENTPENMMQWIRNPKSVDDKTAMPVTGVTERDSRDIVAYLYTLR